jgi:hypothetical protein
MKSKVDRIYNVIERKQKPIRPVNLAPIELVAQAPRESVMELKPLSRFLRPVFLNKRS